MSQLNTMFGPPAREPGQRYAVRPEHRDWTLQQDFSIWPVLLNCPDEAAYLEACRWLCETLGRPPQFPASARPTIADRTREAVSLIERRTITEMLSGRAGAFDFARWLCTGLRTGKPLIWAEKTRFLQPFAFKLAGKGNGRVIDAGWLMLLLERKMSDYDMISDYISTVRQGRIEPPDEWPSPIHGPRQGVITECLARFNDADVHDECTLMKAWMQLHQEAMFYQH